MVDYQFSYFRASKSVPKHYTGDRISLHDRAHSPKAHDLEQNRTRAVTLKCVEISLGHPIPFLPGPEESAFQL
jgi:hypothetical protein